MASQTEAAESLQDRNSRSSRCGNCVWNRGKLLWQPVTLCAFVMLTFMFADVTKHTFFSPAMRSSRAIDGEHSLYKRDIPTGRGHRGIADTSDCVTPGPTSRDLDQLCHGLDCSLVYCRHIRSRGQGHAKVKARTTCFNKVCRYFSLAFLNKKSTPTDVRKNVSVQGLASIIDAQLYSGRMDPQDVRKWLNISCGDSESFLFEKSITVELDIDVDTSSGEPADNTENMTKSEVNLHVLYFRFLSRWESFVKLPRLNGLLEHLRYEKTVRVYSSENSQSLGMRAEENLRALLEGSVYSKLPPREMSRENLLIQAQERGRCLNIETITCKKSIFLEELVQYADSINISNKCEFTSTKSSDDLQHWPEVNKTTNIRCGDTEDDLVENSITVEETLNNALNSSTGKLFTFTYVNAPDLPSLYALDSSVTRLVSKSLSSRRDVVYIVSDLGDPRLSRFDTSVFLRWQTFNPLLHLISPSYLPLPYQNHTIETLGMFEKGRSNFRLATLLDVYESLKEIVTPEDGGRESSTVTTDNSTTLNSTSDLRESGQWNDSVSNEPNNRNCPASILIKGPVECSCLGRVVHDFNDSVQAGFAAFVVGSLNNKLRDLYGARQDDDSTSGRQQVPEKSYQHRLQAIKNSRRCDRLVGVSFENVQHVLLTNVSVAAMELTLRTATSFQNQPIKVFVEIEYETPTHFGDLNPNVLLTNPETFHLSDISGTSSHLDRVFRQSLCHEPNSLSETFASRQSYLKSLSPLRSHFEGHTRLKCLHYPCLYAVTTHFRESSMLEVANVCQDRSYRVEFAAELFDVTSLSPLPTEIFLGPRDVRFVTSLVKAGYGLSQFAYGIKTSYSVIVND